MGVDLAALTAVEVGDLEREAGWFQQYLNQEDHAKLLDLALRWLNNGLSVRLRVGLAPSRVLVSIAPKPCPCKQTEVEKYAHGGWIVKRGNEFVHSCVMIVNVGGDLLEELEGIGHKVHKQIRIIVAAIYEVVVQLSKAQTLPVDKLLATLLYEQLEVAETNSFTEVSNYKSPCRVRG